MCARTHDRLESYPSCDQNEIRDILRYILSVIKTCHLLRFLLLLLSISCASGFCYARSPYKYFRLGNKDDIRTKPMAGIAMMGGGSDLDEAFRWLCNKGNGGDFLIIRARPATTSTTRM